MKSTTQKIGLFDGVYLRLDDVVAAWVNDDTMTVELRHGQNERTYHKISETGEEATKALIEFAQQWGKVAKVILLEKIALCADDVVAAFIDEDGTEGRVRVELRHGGDQRAYQCYYATAEGARAGLTAFNEQWLAALAS